MLNMTTKISKASFGLAVVLLLGSNLATADDTEDAFKLCRALKATGLTTECVVNGRSVDVTIDTNGAEARKICAGVAGQMSQKTRSFGGRWTLRILSPYSGNKAIAVCTL